MRQSLLRSGSRVAVLVFLGWGTALRSAPAESAAASADAGLAAFFHGYLEARFALRPSEATSLGDHRFDDQLEDLTPAGRARWTEQTRSAMAALPTRVDRNRLSRAGQIDYAILEHEWEKSLWLEANLDPFANDPRVYSEYISGSVATLLTQSTLPRETNVAHAIARMHAVPRLVAAARSNLGRPPRVYVETAMQQNQGAIGFYSRDVFQLAGRTRQPAALRAAAAAVVECLQDYQRFLSAEVLPRADGEWRVGPARFARKLELELDAALTADQVLADAQAEFVRVERAMEVIARQLWSRYFPGQPLPPEDGPGRREAIARVVAQVGRDHGRPEHLVRDVRQAVERARRFIREADILQLPEPDLCRVIEMPEFQRGNSTAYMNSPPPLDANAVGFYAVSPPPRSWDAARVTSYLEEYNRSMLQVLTIHEAFPGHYVQLEYSNRNPSLIRKVFGSGVFIEGWAVYTEQMMLDQGYGGGDLPLRLSQLKFYLRAVANAILDHEMQAGTMADDEALAFLMERAFQSEGEARLKIIRSKQSSVQLSTYFVGRMAHHRLRQQVQREWGDRFVLGRYHEAVLAHGSVPVKFLPELVRERLAVSLGPPPAVTR